MVKGSDGEQSDGGSSAQLWFVASCVGHDALRDRQMYRVIYVFGFRTLSLCLLLVADCGVDSLMTQWPVGLFEFIVLAPRVRLSCGRHRSLHTGQYVGDLLQITAARGH